MTATNDRDLVGFGRSRPNPPWRERSPLALSLVLNYEEGGERTVLNDDPTSESYIHELGPFEARAGERDLNTESLYGYGARAGVWRILRLFEELDVTATVFGVGRALALNPEVGRQFARQGLEVASHNWRWFDYAGVDEETERQHILMTKETIREQTGEAPVGFYCGRVSANSRRLAIDCGGLLYDSDAYDDDIPYWLELEGRPPPPRHSLRARHQRHEVQHRQRLRLADGVRRLSLRGLRRALSGGDRRAPVDALGGAPLPRDRQAGTPGGAASLSRARPAPRRRVDLPPRGYRADLPRRRPLRPGAARRAMAVHFTEDEFDRRRAAAVRALAARGLAGILLFKQESMYYLTGFDTFGFCFFQCLWLGSDGRMTLLTRAPDLRQAQHTSIIEDIRVWVDEAGADPAGALRDIVAAHGGAGARIGIERDSYGLTAANWLRVEQAFGEFCALEDASDLVSALRLVKSESELAHVRRAAELADDALAEAERLAVPGAFEGDILAAMQGAVFRGGGEYPGNPFILSSGPDALLCRDKAGRRRLAAQDQLTIEFAGAYCRYHAALMRTLAIGPVSDAHAAMHRACSDALDACRDTLQPRPHLRGGVRCPRPGARRGRLSRASPQRLRLQPGRHLRAHMDGWPDVLCRQCANRGARHGPLRPHHPREQR